MFPLRGLRFLLAAAAVLLTTGALRSQTPSPLPAATWDHLPRWRGFNLLNFFQSGGGTPKFQDADFQQISELGFNFVRIPIDYRIYIRSGNWTNFSETTLRELDRAVSLGRTYGIHVCLNLHRIPGYTVATPPEARNLFTDPEAQQVAAKHWAMLAERYVGIPNENLSFNLLNEPPDVTPAAYSNVVAILCRAIRGVDPGRLIIADGLGYARVPVPELIPLQVAQATRGYTPFGLTHYRASWVSGSDQWSEPQWPSPLVPNFLYGPVKPEFRSTLNLKTTLSGPTTLRIRVTQVSDRSRLVVRANGVSVLNHLFVPGPGTGEWSEVVYVPEYRIYQNRYDRDFTATLPAGTTTVSIANTEGDWMTFREIGLRPEAGGDEDVLRPGVTDWGVKQSQTVTYRDQDPIAPFRFTSALDRAWLWKETLAPWIALREKGVGVMVGEWGSHQNTPHRVTLDWMRDALTNFELADLGWAVWNFGGSFGPLDSGRRDVTYETWRGRKVDRKMLDLLQDFSGHREAYHRWRDRMLPTADVPAGLAGPDADANGDGLTNGLCYALGIDPREPASGGLPLLEVLGDPVGNGAEFRYLASRREVGTTFRIRTSSDLKTWEDLDALTTTVPVSADLEERRVPVSVDGVRRYFQLQVELAPEAPAP